MEIQQTGTVEQPTVPVQDSPNERHDPQTSTCQVGNVYPALSTQSSQEPMPLTIQSWALDLSSMSHVDVNDVTLPIPPMTTPRMISIHPPHPTNVALPLCLIVLLDLLLTMNMLTVMILTSMSKTDCQKKTDFTILGQPTMEVRDGLVLTRDGPGSQSLDLPSNGWRNPATLHSPTLPAP